MVKQRRLATVLLPCCFHMSNKRSATSPLYDTNEKRSCRDEQDGSLMEDTIDSDETILNTDYLSGTLVDSNESSTAGMTEKTPGGGGTMKDQIRDAFCDPALIELIPKALLEKEDREILLLQDRVDELEQYSRRNNIRINDIPESDGENTDEIIQAIGNEIGVTITEIIDRSHRVGKKYDGYCRPIICKFTAYRYKQRLIKEKKKLSSVDAKQLFPDRTWRPRRIRRRGPDSSTNSEMKTKIYLNDDLPRTRADIASKARELKSDGIIQETWVRDGIIFVRQNGTTYRVTTVRELAVFG
ncbi:hypothetical protein BaRGS_00034141 [Batillaria attramentaria]|uniref:Uncharacterized protein n=2 Tax=Batillaria attramentaria TaxID=370345 RepID=A0ABD0JI40_9CAEN